MSNLIFPITISKYALLQSFSLKSSSILPWIIVPASTIILRKCWDFEETIPPFKHFYKSQFKAKHLSFHNSTIYHFPHFSPLEESSLDDDGEQGTLFWGFTFASLYASCCSAHEKKTRQKLASISTLYEYDLSLLVDCSFWCVIKSWSS